MPRAPQPKIIRLPRVGRVGTGWLPSVPDARDFHAAHDQIAPIVGHLQARLKRKRRGSLATKLPPRVDLRPWCSPIEHQLELRSCTAHSAVAIAEYFQRRSFGKHIDGSRLFVYKMTRIIAGNEGDSGAWLRHAMGALVTFGLPPEKFWPYTDASPDFDREPPAYVHALAQQFEATKYFCHDPHGLRTPKPDVLASVKRYLAAGVPAMFGFFGYGSCSSAEAPGDTPMPTPEEIAGRPAFCHAVVAVGYDDDRVIVNRLNNHRSKGALLYRNHAGTLFGEDGYGWIPYEYVLTDEALEFWSMISMEWVDQDSFYGLPGGVG